MFIKNKLMSLNFINEHRASSKDFSRKRKLPFINVFLLIFRKSVKSLQPYLDAGFCLYTLKEALKQGKHEIFNSDQGVQFTCYNFITELEHANIKISMDHKGRCFDNIFVERLWRTLKQEAIYYYRPNSIRDLNLIINDFVGWYNYRRLHQTLNYKVPADLYYHKQ